MCLQERLGNMINPEGFAHFNQSFLYLYDGLYNLMTPTVNCVVRHFRMGGDCREHIVSLEVMAGKIT